MTSGDAERGTATRPERLIAGRYLLHDILGRGGMGTVWRAHDQLLDRPVAAKELHIATAGDEDHRVRVRRTIREARAVARVPHPHVVGVHDLVESEDRLWIVMEFIEGSSLAHRITGSGPLTPGQAAAVGLQLVEALDAAHTVGTLHRDVKPANVLLRRDGSAVLTDFGIAAFDDGEYLTTTGELVGSVEYMAPERVTGAEAGPPSDLWSLGATLATVCGGQSPFRRPGAPATMHAVAYEDPVLPERLGALRPVVEALLRKNPVDRPSAAAVRSALQGVVAGRTDAEPLPPATLRVVLPSLVPADADADTMTGGRSGLAPVAPAGAGMAGVPGAPSGRHTATLVPPPPQASGTTGRKKAWWALAGTAVLAAGVAGGLFLTGTLPLKDGPKADTARQVVQSAVGWQSVAGVSVRRGDRVTVQFVSGAWTTDDGTLPMTGPAGYDAHTDGLPGGPRGCKIKGSAPLAALLARLAGEQDFPVHTVGRKLIFRAAGDGTLQLGINAAAGACSEDNKGALTVQVSVTPQR